VKEAEANVERAEKDAQQLQAKLYQAQRDWTRAQNLFKTSPGALSESDYDLAKSTYEGADAAVGVGAAAIDQAKAAVTNAKAAVTKATADLSTARAVLKRAQTNLGYCTIKSPVNGVIIDRRINVGQTVVSSLNSPSLFLLAKDLKRMQVWVSVNEADIGHIQSGQKVRFTVDAFPDQTFLGVVAPDQPRLNASMTQNVVTYTVVVTTDNSNGRLLPYLTADVQFEVDQHNGVLIVPNGALRWQPSAERLAASNLAPVPKEQAAQAANGPDEASTTEGTIWVSDGEGRVRPLKVRTLLNDGARSEIVGEGLQEGIAVVVGEESVGDETQAADPFLPKMFNTRRPQQ
jgi:HlyD family secretion protein